MRRRGRGLENARQGRGLERSKKLLMNAISLDDGSARRSSSTAPLSQQQAAVASFDAPRLSPRYSLSHNPVPRPKLIKPYSPGQAEGPAPRRAPPSRLRLPRRRRKPPAPAPFGRCRRGPLRQRQEGRARLLGRARHLRHPRLAPGDLRLRGRDFYRRPRPGRGARARSRKSRGRGRQGDLHRRPPRGVCPRLCLSHVPRQLDLRGHVFVGHVHREAADREAADRDRARGRRGRGVARRDGEGERPGTCFFFIFFSVFFFSSRLF